MILRQQIKYIWRIIGKLFSFFIFGLGSIFIVTAIFPVIFLFTLGSKKQFKRLGFLTVSKSFQSFIWFMKSIQIITFHVDGLEKLKDLKSTIIVANHPSLLDVVMLISIIPNSDCLVKASLGNRNIMRGVVNRLYIHNSENFNDIIKESTESLQDGNCFIIFPSGTRAIFDKPTYFKKGAARIALNSGCDIIPIYFGGNEKIGLRKNDKMLSFHPTDRYHYRLEVLEKIIVSSYKEMPMTIATTKLTEDMINVFERKRLNLD